MGGASPASQSRQVAYGYPVKSAKELGLTAYFKSNPNVAGMAWGGGQNKSPMDEPRSVVFNPYNQYMANPQQRDGLFKIEAARHYMDETGYNPQFELTPEQQKWRKGLGEYAKDEKALRQSMVSRMIAKSAEIPKVTQEQMNVADEFKQKFDNRGLVEAGNIDMAKRPIVKNQDGSISTIRSISIGTDRGEVLIPTIADDGRQLSEEGAIDQYKKTGNHLGVFKTPEAASSYAKELSKKQGLKNQ
jgi:hypothetical protein